MTENNMNTPNKGEKDQNNDDQDKTVRKK